MFDKGKEMKNEEKEKWDDTVVSLHTNNQIGPFLQTKTYSETSMARAKF